MTVVCAYFECKAQSRQVKQAYRDGWLRVTHPGQPVRWFCWQHGGGVPAATPNTVANALHRPRGRQRPQTLPPSAEYAEPG